VIKKPIAVISDNMANTIRWLRLTYDITYHNHAMRSLTAGDGTTYVIVTSKEDALAWEFGGLIFDPMYKSLEQEVMSRIR